MRRALSLAQANLEDARRSVQDLHAAPLEGKTLSEALAALAQDIEAQAGFQVSFEPVGAARPLSPRVESGLFRIAQEALNNVVQHARASHVLLRLATTPDAATLRVSDDGVGFDLNQVRDGRFGLIGLSDAPGCWAARPRSRPAWAPAHASRWSCRCPLHLLNRPDIDPHDRRSARRKPQGFSPGGPVRPAPWLGRRAFPRLQPYSDIWRVAPSVV